MGQKDNWRKKVWYKRAIVYELHVKSFYDANQDGIGDFSGLIEKLDYLQSLGVTCLWLLPFFPSPLRDDGYDISDYCGVHPSYGTLDQFKQFIEAAHARHLHVVIELVLNALLSDGRPVHLRMARPDDRERLRAFHARLSKETVYFRYFSAKPRISERALRSSRATASESR